MKNKAETIAFSLVIGIITIFLVGCKSSENKIKKARTVRNDHYSYSFKLPKSWEKITAANFRDNISQIRDLSIFDDSEVEYSQYYYDPSASYNFIDIEIVKLPTLFRNVAIRDFIESNEISQENTAYFRTWFEKINGKEYYLMNILDRAAYGDSLNMMVAMTIYNGFCYTFLASSIGEDITIGPKIVKSIKVKVPGLIIGFTDGMKSPISFVNSIFRDSDDIVIYAKNNLGRQYMVGFILGIIALVALVIFFIHSGKTEETHPEKKI